MILRGRVERGSDGASSAERPMRAGRRGRASSHVDGIVTATMADVTTPPAAGEDQPPTAVPTVGRGVEILAGRSVGGRVDAGVVLVLRAVRRLWAPALVLGMTWLLATGDLYRVSAEDLDTVTELLEAFLSPLVGIALAIGVRLVAGVLGSVAALPRAWAELVADGERRSAGLARMADVLFLTGALRSLRFTAAARDVAAARLGAAGRVALVVDRVETWLGPAAVAAFVLVLLVRA